MVGTAAFKVIMRSAERAMVIVEIKVEIINL
jgi:hypothetical protein